MEQVIELIIGAVLIAAVSAVLFALPIMWLWNFTCPDVFGLPEINFWQSLALSALSGLLFNRNSSSND